MKHAQVLLASLAVMAAGAPAQAQLTKSYAQANPQIIWSATLQNGVVAYNFMGGGTGYLDGPAELDSDDWLELRDLPWFEKPTRYGYHIEVIVKPSTGEIMMGANYCRVRADSQKLVGSDKDYEPDDIFYTKLAFTEAQIESIAKLTELVASRVKGVHTVRMKASLNLMAKKMRQECTNLIS